MRSGEPTGTRVSFTPSFCAISAATSGSNPAICVLVVVEGARRQGGIDADADFARLQDLVERGGMTHSGRHAQHQQQSGSQQT